MRRPPSERTGSLSQPKTSRLQGIRQSRHPDSNRGPLWRPSMQPRPSLRNVLSKRRSPSRPRPDHCSTRAVSQTADPWLQGFVTVTRWPDAFPDRACPLGCSDTSHGGTSAGDAEGHSLHTESRLGSSSAWWTAEPVVIGKPDPTVRITYTRLDRCATLARDRQARVVPWGDCPE